MTKRDLIDEIVKLYPAYSRRDAEVIVNAVFIIQQRMQKIDRPTGMDVDNILAVVSRGISKDYDVQDNVRRDRDQVPLAGSVPVIGDAFAFRDEEVSKTELVIFLKPTVIANPSLDSDELKFFQRFLPTIDPTGKQP